MAAMGVGPVKIERQISLPMNQAMKIALRNITIRLGRALITGAGTMLGIAFLMSVFTSYLAQVASDVPISPEQQQKNTWLVVMSLLVSAVGITNSMLMSVTERFKEIGTMKCLGALDGFIVKLFLIEAGLLGFTASVIGWVIGYVAVVLVGLIREGARLWPKLPPGEVGMSLLLCLVIGAVLTVLATVFPAIRASHLPPAAALRVEI